MPRAKKDGRHINYYIDRQIFEALEAYAGEKRYPLTTAVEVLLEKGLKEEGKILSAENKLPKSSSSVL